MYTVRVHVHQGSKCFTCTVYIVYTHGKKTASTTITKHWSLSICTTPSSTCTLYLHVRMKGWHVVLTWTKKLKKKLRQFNSFLRVSVPRSSLLSPYQFKPHRRSSFDPTDAMSLSSHCLAGWESSKPTVVPMPSSLDLRTSLHQSRTTLVSA